MALDLAQERQQAHALIDLLPPAKLGAVRNLPIPHEEVLAEFGLTMADWEKMRKNLKSAVARPHFRWRRDFSLVERCQRRAISGIVTFAEASGSVLRFSH